MEIQPVDIMNELKKIRIDINFLKTNMPDKEMFLSSEEEILFSQSLENEAKGNLISSEKLKKEFGI